jgi:hypothetical protein
VSIFTPGQICGGFFDETFVVVWELTTTGLSDAILPAGGGFQNPKKNPLQGYYS